MRYSFWRAKRFKMPVYRAAESSSMPTFIIYRIYWGRGVGDLQLCQISKVKTWPAYSHKYVVG